MAGHNRVGCCAVSGEQCWGMSQGVYQGTCEWCRQEHYLMTGYEADLTGPGSAGKEEVVLTEEDINSWITTEFPVEGVTKVEDCFRGNWQ